MTVRAITGVIASLASLLGVGCTASDAELFIDLRTDFVPVQELIGVRVTHGTVRYDHVVDPDAPYDEGVRVAEVGVPRGTTQLDVALIGRDGGLLMERPLLVTTDASRAVTVVMTRDCRGVACPVADADPLANACLGGVCVPSTCLDGADPDCGEPGCTDDADCTAASCATAACQAGVCLRHARPEACDEGSYCDPDFGCRPSTGANLVTGPARPEALVLYDFSEGEGALVRDRSSREPYIDLRIEDPSRVSWREDGLEVLAEARLAQRTGTGAALVERLHVVGQFTVEAWVEDTADDSDGPNRLFSMEQTPAGAQDLMLGTTSGRWVFRLDTDPAVDDEFDVGDVSRMSQHVVVTYADATLRSYVDGALASEHEVGTGRPRWEATQPPMMTVANVPPGRATDVATANRFWTGVLRRIALHEVAWTEAEVAAAFEAGPDR